MPLSQTYYDSLVEKAKADAVAKKAAFDAALQRATAVQFDTSGNIVTDAQGNPVYKQEGGTNLQGSLDVAYANQKRATKAGAESTGMLRSGQLARANIENLGTYRTNLINALNQTTSEKTGVDTGLARQLAEYQAMYGPGTSTAPTSSSGTTTTGTGTTTKNNTSSSSSSSSSLSSTPNFSTAPTTGRGGMGSVGTAKPKPVSPPKPVTPTTIVKKPTTIIKPGGKR